MTVLVYRSKEASYACKRVAAAAPGIRAVQQDAYVHQPDDRAVVRWDSYAQLPIPGGDVIDVNPLDSVHVSRNKITSRVRLAELAPPTWFEQADVQVPCVVRPAQHKGGARFYVVREMNNVRKMIGRARRRGGWYASRLIDKAREFRVFIVQGRVVAVSERFPGTDEDSPVSRIAWNLALGGRLINVARAEWPVPVLRASIDAMSRLGLGFGAVDVAIDASGAVWVFEANTSPALRNKFTIKQIAKGLADSKVPKAVKAGALKPVSYAHPSVQ